MVVYLKTWVRNNVLKGKINNRPGMYSFYDRNGRRLYVGHSKVLRHRLQSYYQGDDFWEHPTKRILRKKIAYFKVEYLPLKHAMAKERKLKVKNHFNYR